MYFEKEFLLVMISNTQKYKFSDKSFFKILLVGEATGVGADVVSAHFPL